MYSYLKVKNDVIAFRDHNMLAVAKYAVCYPHHVHLMPGGYSIFHARESRNIQVIKKNEREYMVDLHITKDSASLFRICRLLKEVNNGA